MKIVMVTNNQHKLNEILHLLQGKIKILKLSEVIDIKDIPETSDTLKGNALQKAKYVSDKCGLNCFADDTGLEVEALNGRPGVYSARYAGPNCSSEDNMCKLLKEMQGLTNRKARFRTVIASIINGETKYFEGIVEGEITTDRSGIKGFGYDPIFKPKGYDITFAEMSMDEKNKISHRGITLRKFALSLSSSS